MTLAMQASAEDAPGDRQRKLALFASLLKPLSSTAEMNEV